MPTFHVELSFHAACRDGRVTLGRRLELPFPPYPGLKVCWGDDPDGYPLTSVTFATDRRLFLCPLVPLRSPETIAQLPAAYAARGWEFTVTWREPR